MNSNRKFNAAKKPAEIWKEFIQSELKARSNLGNLLEKSSFGGYEDKTRSLTVYLGDEETCKKVKGQIVKLKDKLIKMGLTCNNIEVRSGEISDPAKTAIQLINKPSGIQKPSNPLQSLNVSYPYFPTDDRGNELPKPILEAAIAADCNCGGIYTKLTQRTEMLAGNANNTMKVSFSWRLRVGGTRGFRELLLPVLHPVFGIPYIPASTLKGAARSWARQHGENSDINRLLGMLSGDYAQAAKVEFLDAFPTKPCLSLDVATPQWSWKGDKVIYKPEPHPLLSLQEPELLIGLRPTARGSNADVAFVKEWLENSLKAGIGSRVSGGYGRALSQVASFPYSKSYNFKVWTQGMYGCEPPTKQNGWVGKVEFRPTALRGVLRYWFRALALSFYDSTKCQELEKLLFGDLGKQGTVLISCLFNSNGIKDPYLYEGRIFLESKDKLHLDILEKILILSSHIGGFGRGSRRPLHLLNGRMRGCQWSLNSKELLLDYNEQQWKSLFSDLKSLFQSLQSPTGSFACDSGQPKSRQQDVLDKNAQVWLLKSADQVPPDNLKNWRNDGNRPEVRGAGLNLLYSSDHFKGLNMQKQGNPHVGGALETPSYVWIKSNFPYDESSIYQALTIFGVDNRDRMDFAKALKNSGALLVFGQMMSSSSNPQSNKPTPPRLRR